MEEPPKVERLISSRGIALSDAANILKSYVAVIDHLHAPPRKQLGADDDAAFPSSDNNIDGGDDDINKKSRQDLVEEQEEERLLARLNQLDPKESSNNRLGLISEDVYERLQMIMESLCGEAEGRVVSAVGAYASSKAAEQSGADEGGALMKEEFDNGEDEFMKELEEAERLETDQQQQQQQQQQPAQIDYEQKKKDKKAKKAAKKAKKEAKKRKASSGGANEEKRIKVEEED